ncbi:serine/threonine kinase [Entomortierella beljakovae]|nr:serine/threonine kinase [Entomortierella beljakovae]
MVAQANIVLGSISESIKFYNKSASIPKHGTLYHKRLLWSMIDAFAANNYASQGIAFLDELPPFFPENEDPKLYMHNLYRRLFLYRFESKERFQPTGNSMAARISLIKSIIEKPYVPSLEHVSRALRRIRRYEEGNQLSKEVGDAIEIFSKVASGMIIKCSDEASETVAAMMQDLILYSQFGEATRVLDLTLHNSVESVMDRIRYRLIEIEMRDEKDRSSDILEKWEAIVALHTKTVTEESVKNDLSATEERWSKYLDTEYSRLVQKSITEFDVPMATVVAKYMSRKGRIARGIDFYYLNSFMVNQCNSLDYMPYLEIRYAVGDPPDLHTYRRLIYASCRRSDISGALTLLKKAKALHPHWVIDTRTYNAIISSASAMGNPYLAKTTFMRLLQDGLKPDIKSYHGLLNGYSLTGNLKEAIKTSELMIKRRLTPTTTTFNLIMKAYLKHSLDMGTSLKIFTVMQESGIKGVPPDIVTFNQLLEGYRKVGNSMWFDAYFDNYFGSTSNKPVRNGETVTAWSAKVPEIRQGQNLIRPEKPSDWTLFIQLRHSLSLTDISLSTVQELWQALKPRLCDLDQNLDGSKPLPSSYPGTNLIKDSEDDLPPTFVPFKKKFGHITMPGTDRAHFRFIILNLFRHAFLIRGDLTGVKTVDGALAMHFPNHPAGSSVRKEKIIKKARQFMEKKIIK